MTKILKSQYLEGNISLNKRIRSRERMEFRIWTADVCSLRLRKLA